METKYILLIHKATVRHVKKVVQVSSMWKAIVTGIRSSPPTTSQNNLEELFNLLHFVSPYRFSSLRVFEVCNTTATVYCPSFCSYS